MIVLYKSFAFIIEIDIWIRIIMNQKNIIISNNCDTHERHQTHQEGFRRSNKLYESCLFAYIYNYVYNYKCAVLKSVTLISG
jgi:hypothetical protein